MFKPLMIPGIATLLLGALSFAQSQAPFLECTLKKAVSGIAAITVKRDLVLFLNETGTGTLPTNTFPMKDGQKILLQSYAERSEDDDSGRIHIYLIKNNTGNYQVTKTYEDGFTDEMDEFSVVADCKEQ